jgi:hypothetical protein
MTVIVPLTRNGSCLLMIFFSIASKLYLLCIIILHYFAYECIRCGNQLGNVIYIIYGSNRSFELQPTIGKGKRDIKLLYEPQDIFLVAGRE